MLILPLLDSNHCVPLRLILRRTRDFKKVPALHKRVKEKRNKNSESWYQKRILSMMEQESKFPS